MRILHVSESLDPAHGGTPAVPKALAAAQAGLGHEVTILTRDEPGRREAIRDSMESIPGADRVRVATVPRGGRLDAWLNRAAKAWAGAHAGEFDFAHLHSMWSPIPHGAARGLEAGGVPFTLCPHGMLDGWSMARSRWKKQLHLGLVSRRTMRRGAFIHALNEHEAGCVRAFNFGPPTEILNNGVFPAAFEHLPARGRFRARHPELGEGPLIVFLSRLHVKKGLDHLAGAFERFSPGHPEARLVVIGPDGGARAEFERRIAGAALEGRVQLTGPLYGPEKIEALVDAACFCLPSRQEGFSVAICEALACGTPVVISPDCHFPEVEAEGAGLVVPRDEEAIASAWRALLSEPERATEIGRKGRSLVFSRYTWPAVAERSVALYAKYKDRTTAGTTIGR